MPTARLQPSRRIQRPRSVKDIMTRDVVTATETTDLAALLEEKKEPECLD
jgi:hypothetical protein